MDQISDSHCIYWVVDVESEMALGRFNEHLALLPAHEQKHVLNFVQPIDQHRALASRLLQRCCVCIALGVKWNDVILAQTKARKPFTTNTKPPAAPNFNFNVSHEGKYVVLVAHPLHLVGVDVAAPRSTRPGHTARRPFPAYLDSFRNQFADCEWMLLQSVAGDDAKQEAIFLRLWSLKEAFVKARGDGLGFQPLSRAAFQFDGMDPRACSAHLFLDGVLQSSWVFQVYDLPHEHCMTVALGPPEAALDELGVFRSTFCLQQAKPTLTSKEPTLKFTTLGELLTTVYNS